MFKGTKYFIAGCVVESGAVASAVGAFNCGTMSLSAKSRMIQSVGVHLLLLVREYRRLLDKMEEGGDE